MDELTVIVPRFQQLEVYRRDVTKSHLLSILRRGTGVESALEELIQFEFQSVERTFDVPNWALGGLLCQRIKLRGSVGLGECDIWAHGKANEHVNELDSWGRHRKVLGLPFVIVDCGLEAVLIECIVEENQLLACYLRLLPNRVFYLAHQTV